MKKGSIFPDARSRPDPEAAWENAAHIAALVAAVKRRAARGQLSVGERRELARLLPEEFDDPEE